MTNLNLFRELTYICRLETDKKFYITTGDAGKSASLSLEFKKYVICIRAWTTARDEINIIKNPEATTILICGPASGFYTLLKLYLNYSTY